jgi:hypothetical protein
MHHGRIQHQRRVGVQLTPEDRKIEQDGAGLPDARRGTAHALCGPKEVPIMPKRELIEPNKSDKRYVRRDEGGKFQEVEDAGRSSAQDQKRESNNRPTRGQGDKGDR